MVEKRNATAAGPDAKQVDVTEIIANVVKIKFESEEVLRKFFRVFNFGGLEGCAAELLESSVHREGLFWTVKLLFKVTIVYRDHHGFTRTMTRLAFFHKKIELPIGIDLRHLHPVVEVKDIRCEAHVLLEHDIKDVEPQSGYGHEPHHFHFHGTSIVAEVHFFLIVKGVRKEEIFVFTPGPR